MQAKFLLIESLQNLRANLMRSALSVIGVVFGVGSVVAMLAIGLGAEAEIESLLDSLGARNIHITSKNLNSQEWRDVIKSTFGLSSRDERLVKSLYPKSPITTVSKWTSRKVNLANQEPKLTILGMTPNYRKILGVPLAYGRSFTDVENDLSAPVGLIGYKRAVKWFGSAEKAINSDVRIEGAWFKVIGVFAKAGNSTEDSKESNAEKNPTAAEKPGEGKGKGLDIKALALRKSFVTPIKSAQARLGPQDLLSPVDRLIVKVSESQDPTVVRRKIESHLTSLHRKASVLNVTAADEIIEQKRSTTRLFSYFLIAIALISLVVGGIGIANVMLASMVERIKEVGLRRAIGAKRHHILSQFLTESLVICLIGGLIGGFAGIAGSAVVGSITGWNIIFPWWGLLVAIAISTVVGLTAGLYPALTAAKISPIEALQGRS